MSNPESAIADHRSRIKNLSAAHKIHDLDTVALSHHHVAESLTLEDCEVVLNSDAPGVYVELRQQSCHRHRRIQFETFTVECNQQGITCARRCSE